MSLKDRGNQFYRVGRYDEAIRCYQQYIDQDPLADKKVAYCNISFCYYKLQQYKQSIESAQDSITEDSTYNKAYYRKLQAYKEIPHSEYEVYINAILLLKYSPDMVDKDKYDYNLLIKEQKQKWISKLQVDRFKVSNDCLIHDPLTQNSQKEFTSLEEWLAEWSDQSISADQKWNKIEQIAKNDGQYGLNLAFLYLNQHAPNQPLWKGINQKIQLLQTSIQKKMDIESQEEEIQQESQQIPSEQYKKGSSSDENLFESSDHEKERKTENIIVTNMTSKEQSLPSQVNSVLQPKIEPKIQAENRQSSKKVEEEHNCVSQKQVNHHCISNQIDKKQETQQTKQQDIELLYKKYTKIQQNSRDQIADLLKCIQKLLTSTLSHPIKHQLLAMIKERDSKDVHLMKTSFTKKQQQKVHDLLLQNNLHAFIPEFASKHTPLQ